MTRDPDLYDTIHAQEAGIAAAETCAENAERQGWDAAGAERFILRYLAVHGPTPGETLVTAASGEYRPHDDRAFGAIIGKLSRAGRIVKAGYAPRAKGHGTSGANIWQLAG